MTSVDPADGVELPPQLLALHEADTEEQHQASVEQQQKQVVLNVWVTAVPRIAMVAPSQFAHVDACLAPLAVDHMQAFGCLPGCSTVVHDLVITSKQRNACIHQEL